MVAALAENRPRPDGGGSPTLPRSGRPGGARRARGAPAGADQGKVPADQPGLRSRDEALGWAWREASAEAFGACFEAGLVAVWVTREGRYLFGRREELP